MNTENIPDEELIRRLDGEVSGAARRALDARIAAAPATEARLAGLRRRSERLSELLGELNPDAAQVRKSADTMRPEVNRAALRARVFYMTPAMKAAAVIVLLLATAFGVPPVRAWVIEQARTIAAALGLREQISTPEAAPTQPTTAPQSADVVYDFVMETDTLDLHMTQLAGQVTLRREERPMASVQVAGITGTGVVLLGSRLRMEGLSAAAARFEVLLPAHVRAVRLHQAERPARLHALPAVGHDLRIDLGGK